MLPRESYTPYRSRGKENLLLGLAGGLLGAGLGYLFFKTITAAVLALPFGYGSLRLGRHKIAISRKNKLERELRDYLLSVLSFLRAGYALENAMAGAEKELRTMHGPESIMGQEAWRMSREIELRIPPEKIWQSFGERTASRMAVSWQRCLP